jgi:predicted ATPase
MRAGEEVSSDALIEFAWPNVFVDKSNLKVHVSSLRRALEDTVPQATYITTVVGHGYQFVGRVQTERAEIAGFSSDDLPVARSLPTPSTLIGREREIAGLGRTLDRMGLVTLVGPGGVGKTSLVIAVANARQADFPDGVHFIDLSATNDSAAVPHLVATALGVRGDPADLISAVVRRLRDRRLLIVLDNCEHVLHGVATIAARITEARVSSCLLATSREPLGINGETLQRVEPLAIPHRADVRTASEAMAYPSVELFALRAFETADYRLIDCDAYAVASLCRALDGLPLAIEIAAAKLGQFSPPELLNSVGHHLSELRNDNEATHSRHRTLWAMLDWSYHLLSATETTIFRLLSVFAGSFEWPDAAGMASLVQYDPHETTVALGGLASKSLISVEVDGNQLRYRLLETVRCYAAERLAKDPLAQDAQRRHAQLGLAVFEKSEAEWAWVDNRVWRGRYEARIGDLRKALDWCFGDGGDASLGVDLAASAIRLWNEQSSIFEQLFQVERALSHCASITDTPRRTAALASSRAWCMSLIGELHGGTDDAWETALNYAEGSGDLGQHLSVMCGHAQFLIWTGRLEQAVDILDNAVRLAVRCGDRARLFDAECLHALAEMHLGKLLEVRPKLERLAEDLTNQSPSRIAHYQLESYLGINITLSFTTWLTGQPARSLAMAEEMLLKTGQSDQLWAHSTILAAVAMPLTMWTGDIGALDRYSAMLGEDLDRENIAVWKPINRFYASVIRNARGDINAVDEMRSSIDVVIGEQSVLRVPMLLGVLAGALLERGRPADADDAVEAALKLQRRTKENWCLPELLRIKAQIMAALGERDRAGAILARARENAIVIGARSLELRIVNDITELAVSDGSSRETAELLLPLYMSFEEQNATVDLRNSARLLSTITEVSPVGL